jgi:predicted metal-dependent HD superfamily phosphohydrolase
MTSSPGFAQRRWPLPVSIELAAELVAAYQAPPRAYHHAGHVDEVLTWFDWVEARVPWQEPLEVFVAVLFHDAVYVPGAADNEARSAALARDAIPGHPELRAVNAERVAQLIAWTARHGRLSAAEVDVEAARFLDCDLAILAASPPRYHRYCDEIAHEYRALPAAAYRAGRRAFVASMLARPRLYLSELFAAELEAAARRNLQAELDGGAGEPSSG